MAGGCSPVYLINPIFAKAVASVYIYNLDATLAGKIDVTRATYDSRPRDPNLDGMTYVFGNGDWKTCVRDASWHPGAPIIAGEPHMRSICMFMLLWMIIDDP